MILKCQCPIADEDSAYSLEPSDYKTLDKKAICGSCGVEIGVGNLLIEHPVFVLDNQLPSIFHCELCADIFFSLTELGFCLGARDSAIDALYEYQQLNQRGTKK